MSIEFQISLIFSIVMSFIRPVNHVFTIVFEMQKPKYVLIFGTNVVCPQNGQRTCSTFVK